VVSNGFGVVARVIGMASSDRSIGAGFAYYGLAKSIYRRWIARGHDVTFARDTRMEIELRNVEIMTKEVSAGGAAGTCLSDSCRPGACTCCAVGQAPGESPAALIGRMVAQELQDREQASYWMYHVEKTVDGHTRSQEQVETTKGPIFRVLAVDGHPLDGQQRREDDRRIKYLLEHPDAAAQGEAGARCRRAPGAGGYGTAATSVSL